MDDTAQAVEGEKFDLLEGYSREIGNHTLRISLTYLDGNLPDYIKKLKIDLDLHLVNLYIITKPPYSIGRLRYLIILQYLD